MRNAGLRQVDFNQILLRRLYRLANGLRTSFGLARPVTHHRRRRIATTTSAANERFFPPFTTLVTRLMATTWSFN